MSYGLFLLIGIPRDINNYVYDEVHLNTSRFNYINLILSVITFTILFMGDIQ